MSAGLEKYAERSDLHLTEGCGPFWQFAVSDHSYERDPVLYRHCSFCGKVERRVWDKDGLGSWKTDESES